MNTRFKVLSVILIFLLSLVIAVFFFSNSGYIARRTMNERLKAIEDEIKEKEGTLNALRYRASGGSYTSRGDGELVYSFPDDDIFDPLSGGASYKRTDGFEGISIPWCVLISLMVTFFYCIVILLVIPLMRRKGVNNGRHHRV